MALAKDRMPVMLPLTIRSDKIKSIRVVTKMPATLTATPNPVGVWAETAGGTTKITWNTGSSARGRVCLSRFTDLTFPLTETLFDGDPDKGDCSGTGKSLAVQFGNNYKLVLRQVSNNGILAILIVTVDDLVQKVLARAAAEALLTERFNQPQSIYDLRIHAGIDTTFVAEQSWITQAFDISEAGDGTIIPMRLNKLRGASSTRIYTLV